MEGVTRDAALDEARLVGAKVIDVERLTDLLLEVSIFKPCNRVSRLSASSLQTASLYMPMSDSLMEPMRETAVSNWYKLESAMDRKQGLFTYKPGVYTV